MNRTRIAAAIFAASATLPALTGWPCHSTPVDRNPIGVTFVEFSDWTRITQVEADVLAESGRPNADTRAWERCVEHDRRIVCPGGYVTRWVMFEDEAVPGGSADPTS